MAGALPPGPLPRGGRSGSEGRLFPLLAWGLVLAFMILFGPAQALASRPVPHDHGPARPRSHVSSYGAQGAPPLLLRAIHRAKLTAPDGAPVDDFGFSVAVSGDTAVVGAWSDDTAAGVGAGSAYVFLHSGNVWTLQAKLAAPD